jgi:hypothetical protein
MKNITKLCGIAVFTTLLGIASAANAQYPLNLHKISPINYGLSAPFVTSEGRYGSCAPVNGGWASFCGIVYVQTFSDTDYPGVTITAKDAAAKAACLNSLPTFPCTM